MVSQKGEFNQQIDQIKQQMTDLDLRSGQISEKLERLDAMETIRLKKIESMTAKEKAKLLDTLLK